MPQKMMAEQRRVARTRGKSDPIDALAVARAYLWGQVPGVWLLVTTSSPSPTAQPPSSMLASAGGAYWRHDLAHLSDE